MIGNEKNFIRNILRNDYSEFTLDDYLVIANHKNIFGIKAELKNMIKKARKSNDLEFELIEIEKYTKENINSYSEIVERLNNISIDDGDLHIKFKENFVNNLNKMTNLQLLFLGDFIGYYAYNTTYQIRFFGGTIARAQAYHELNLAISECVGSQFAFQILGKRLEFVYLQLDYERINRVRYIKTLVNRCKHYQILLEGLTNIILDYSDEEIKQINLKEFKKELNKETLVFRKQAVNMNKKVKEYDRSAESWSITIDKYYDENEE